MNCGDAEGRVAMPGAAKPGRGRKPRRGGDGVSRVTAKRGHSHPETLQLMEAVVERENMKRAWLRVRGNKGAAGVDGMNVDALLPYLREHWPNIKENLLAGRYQPNPVRKVEIPKPGGGVRQLGIPTVLDRLIQQALHQVLQPIFDPGFSASSYGFRPGRGAQQAMAQAKVYVAEGKRWVVDLDLEKFFDRVNHDILMARLARKISDKRVLRLIRRYLQAGLMESGLVSPRTEGTPQGGPLSPLLSNILLNDMDKELERRGHSFCRYADDCNTYVRSRRAGERLMASLSLFLATKLKLKVNQAKSAVDRPWRRKFLGYSMTWHRKPRLKVAPASLARLKDKVRERLQGGQGRNLKRQIVELTPLLRGWVNYFGLIEVKGVLGELDGWLRRKLRCILWRQWKRTYTRGHNLMRRGLDKDRALKSAMNGRGPWWNAGASHMNAAFPKRFFDELGLVSLLDYLRLIQSTA
jgi:RNA-directed DNA polymerase